MVCRIEPNVQHILTSTLLWVLIDSTRIYASNNFLPKRERKRKQSMFVECRLGLNRVTIVYSCSNYDDFILIRLSNPLKKHLFLDVHRIALNLRETKEKAKYCDAHESKRVKTRTRQTKKATKKAM
jgi:hypothetical protein